MNTQPHNTNEYYESKRGSQVFVPPPSKKSGYDTTDDSKALFSSPDIGVEGGDPFWMTEMDGVGSDGISQFLASIYSNYEAPKGGSGLSQDDLISLVWDRGVVYTGTGSERTSSAKPGTQHTKGSYTRTIVIPPRSITNIHSFEEVAKAKDEGLEGGPDSARKFKSLSAGKKNKTPYFRMKLGDENWETELVQDYVSAVILREKVSSSSGGSSSGDSSQDTEEEFCLLGGGPVSMECKSYEEMDGGTEAGDPITFNGSAVWGFIKQTKVDSSGGGTSGGSGDGGAANIFYAGGSEGVTNARSIAGGEGITVAASEGVITITGTGGGAGGDVPPANSMDPIVLGGVNAINYFNSRPPTAEAPNAPRIMKGVIMMPRANFVNKTVSSPRGPDIVGMVGSVTFGGNSSAKQPSIIDGVINLPVVSFSSSEGSGGAPNGELGVVKSIGYGASSNKFSCSEGTLLIPLCLQDPTSSASNSGQPGIVKSVGVATYGGGYSITEGEIKIARANDGRYSGDPTAGVVERIEVSDPYSGEDHNITEGQISLAHAEYSGGDGNSSNRSGVIRGGYIDYVTDPSQVQEAFVIRGGMIYLTVVQAAGYSENILGW